MFVMYDAVTVGNIPNGPHAVAGYVNGNFITVPELRKRFPHAHVLEISVAGDVAAHCYDVETGDYSPGDVPRLFQIARDAGIWRPCFYANLSTMPEVKRELNKVIPNREAVRLWVAAYDGLAVVPPGYDAKQFTDRALNRDLDESLCADGFFGPVKPAPDIAWEARVSLDPDSRSWSISPLPAGEVKP